MRPQKLILPLAVILFNYLALKLIKCHDRTNAHPKIIKHEKQKQKHQKVEKEKDEIKEENVIQSPLNNAPGGHKLAIIVPFRDRFDELMEFAPAMHTFLNEANVAHEIIVVNQVDSYRFNRAALINAGFVHTLDTEIDYIVMHDVDLIPQTHQIKYEYPSDGPVHIASPELHPKYHYANYVGGILMFSHNDFKKVNGMSNNFWGWGREDDELFLRIRDVGLELHRPKGVTTGYETFKHVHDKVKRPRDYKRIGDQKKQQFKRDLKGGFHTLKHKVARIDELNINSTPVKILHVELECNKEETPWCENQ